MGVGSYLVEPTLVFYYLFIRINHYIWVVFRKMHQNRKTIIINSYGTETNRTHRHSYPFA